MKRLISLIIGLLMIASVIAAPPVPAPVKITLSINGVSADYANTIVTNKRTGEVLTKSEVPSLAIVNGIGLFDLSEFNLGYEPANTVGYSGDEIEIIACNVDVDCTKSFNVADTNPRTIDFSISTGDYYVCWDNSLVSNPSNCPAQPEEPEPVIEVIEAKVSSVDSDTAKIESCYGQDIDVKIGDSKLSALLDDVIDFNDNEYDVKEEIYFKGIVKTSLDDDDFGTEPYLIIEEDSIEYRYIFVDEITLSEISEDEELEIDFLGKKIRIIDASANAVTLRTGEEYFLKEGEEFVIDGNTLKVITIGEDSVLIDVDGSQSIVSLENDVKIDELNVFVTEILYKDYEGESFVELLVGKDSDKEISDGDDFELFSDNDEWEWIIKLPGYIGISNNNEYKYIDDEYKPIKESETIVLPNDYLEIKFNDVVETDRVELKIKVREGYLQVDGNVEDSFADEYDKLFINSEGIFDEDYALISTDKVRIGDSDTYLELGSIKIGKLEIKLDMSDILYDGVSFSSKDGDYLDYFGIIFKDPEQAIDDKSGFVVSVPEEKPEVFITISSKITEIVEEVVDEVIDEVVEEIVEEKPVEEIVEEKEEEIVTEVIEETKDEPEDEDFFLSVLEILGLLLAAIGVTWRAGYLGLVKYYWKKGDKARAIKMLFTATKRAKEDYYKNKK